MDAQVGTDDRDARVPFVEEQRRVARQGEESGREAVLGGAATCPADRLYVAGAERRDDDATIKAVGNEHAPVAQFTHAADLRKVSIQYRVRLVERDVAWRLWRCLQRERCDRGNHQHGIIPSEGSL